MGAAVLGGAAYLGYNRMKSLKTVLSDLDRTSDNLSSMCSEYIGGTNNIIDRTKFRLQYDQLIIIKQNLEGILNHLNNKEKLYISDGTINAEVLAAIDQMESPISELCTDITEIMDAIKDLGGIGSVDDQEKLNIVLNKTKSLVANIDKTNTVRKLAKFGLKTMFDTFKTTLTSLLANATFDKNDVTTWQKVSKSLDLFQELDVIDETTVNDLKNLVETFLAKAGSSTSQGSFNTMTNIVS